MYGRTKGRSATDRLKVGLALSLGGFAPITTGSLVQEMTDLHRLTQFPNPAYKTVLFCSYDRTSTLPGGPGWHNNNDGFGGEPVPDFDRVLTEPGDDGVGEYLLCDVEGPGAIVRTCTAGINGTIRVYLDGARVPLYDGSAFEFLRCPYQPFLEDAGIDAADLLGSFIQRDGAYCPIPFAEHCRIIWIGKIAEMHFYHVDVRRYEPGPPVVTFTPADLSTYAGAIRDAARVLREPGKQYVYRSTERPKPIDATIAPGERKRALTIEGPRAIERLTLKVTADDVAKALRQTILHVICDGYPCEQVQAPIGDFFGSAPGINPFDSLPFTVLADGTMTCRYVMPFERSLAIVLENRGAQPVTVSGDALCMDYEWDPDTSMHFRARWRVDHDLVGQGDPAQDLPLLIACGKGVYVGTAVYLLNPCPTPTSAGNWWGEGDERVFVDDDTFPSLSGNGSEDYFNYTWSSPDIFCCAYCGQVRNDGPGNRGFVSSFRWHILDSLPFEKRLAFYFELFTHERTPGMSYARMGYHYGRPGMMDDQVAITDEDVRALDLPPDWQPAARGGAWNTTFHAPEDLVAPRASTREETGNLWSGGRLLVWEPAAVGDEMSFRIPVAADGRNALILGLALTGNAGVLSVRLDGEQVPFGGGGSTIDLHVPYRVLLRQYGSHPLDLPKGEHTLTLRCESLSPTLGPTAFGIDYLGTQRLQ
jgi:hypothetical protein